MNNNYYLIAMDNYKDIYGYTQENLFAALLHYKIMLDKTEDIEFFTAKITEENYKSFNYWLNLPETTEDFVFDLLANVFDFLYESKIIDLSSYEKASAIGFSFLEDHTPLLIELLNTFDPAVEYKLIFLK